MSYDHTPYWFWPLDRWKLLLTLVLALALLLVAATHPPEPTAVVAPVLLLPSPDSIFAEGEPVQIGGSAEAEQVVSVLLCSTDAHGLPQCDEVLAYPLAETTADATGQWRIIAPPLAPGQHGVMATTSTELDQTLTSSVITFVVQPAPPSVIAPSFNSPERAEQPTQPIELTGEASVGNAVFLFVDETFLGSTYADETGLWRFTMPELDVGTHFLVTKVLAPDGTELGVSEPFIVLVVPEP